MGCRFPHYVDDECDRPHTRAAWGEAQNQEPQALFPLPPSAIANVNVAAGTPLHSWRPPCAPPCAHPDPCRPPNRTWAGAGAVRAPSSVPQSGLALPSGHGTPAPAQPPAVKGRRGGWRRTYRYCQSMNVWSRHSCSNSATGCEGKEGRVEGTALAMVTLLAWMVWAGRGGKGSRHGLSACSDSRHRGR